MKWGMVAVAVVIGGAAYYFWQQAHFEAKGPGVKTQVEVKAKPQPQQPQKQIPAGTIMEDGTI